MLLAKRARRQRFLAADEAAPELCRRRQVEDVEHRAVALETCAIGRAGPGRGRGVAGLDQHVGETGDLQHRAHLGRGAGDDERTVDALQLLVALHDHGNARRAHEDDVRQVQTDAIVPLAQRLLETLLQVIGPVAVEPSADAELQRAGRRDASDFHAYGRAPITRCARARTAAGIRRPTTLAASVLTISFVSRAGSKGIEAGLSPRITRTAIRAAAAPASR